MLKNSFFSLFFFFFFFIDRRASSYLPSFREISSSIMTHFFLTMFK